MTYIPDEWVEKALSASNATTDRERRKRMRVVLAVAADDIRAEERERIWKAIEAERNGTDEVRSSANTWWSGMTDAIITARAEEVGND